MVFIVSNKTLIKKNCYITLEVLIIIFLNDVELFYTMASCTERFLNEGHIEIC